MKRIITVLAVVAVMAAMVAANALPAFAVANPHASCQGAGHSNQFPGPGAAGDYHGTYGPSIDNADFAKQGPEGKDRDNSGEVIAFGQSCG